MTWPKKPRPRRPNYRAMDAQVNRTLKEQAKAQREANLRALRNYLDGLEKERRT